jgi:outer membrane protein, multidrug efflux system
MNSHLQIRHPTPLRRWWTIALAAVTMAGCSVRQPYNSPATVVPNAWSRPTTGDAGANVEQLAQWWVAFRDPQLTDLIRRAIEGNRDVRAAVSRLREARASTRSTRALLRPAVDAAGSSRVSRTGGAALGGDIDAGGITSDSYSLGLDASWELDVFGGIRSTVDAAAATENARQADLDDVLVSLSAEVALGYVDVRTLQQRLEIARTNARLQQETLELTQFRAQAGLATELDVQQARSNVESTQAQMASLQGQLGQSIHAVAILLGRPPAELDAELGATAAIPEAPVDAAIGVPADALRRRPDVRSAERLLAAQFAQVNAARADLYPSFRLAGSIGLESFSFVKWLVPGAAVASGGPSVSTRLFNRRQLRENVVIQSERQQQAALTYESRVLAALQEVEDTLVALAQEQVRRGHLTSAADAAEQASDLSLQLYTAGLRDFRDVLDSQRALLSLQDSLATSSGQLSTYLIRLYKALGGGWSATTLLPEEIDPAGS